MKLVKKQGVYHALAVGLRTINLTTRPPTKAAARIISVWNRPLSTSCRLDIVEPKIIKNIHPQHRHKMLQHNAVSWNDINILCNFVKRVWDSTTILFGTAASSFASIASIVLLRLWKPTPNVCTPKSKHIRKSCRRPNTEGKLYEERPKALSFRNPIRST